MTMVKNFGLGGVASKVQLGKEGAALASSVDVDVSKEIIEATDVAGELTNIRAADPVKDTDVVTKGWTKGSNITLGEAGDGSLSEGGAVQLAVTDTVTNAVDSLNEILGKLIPTAPKNFPAGETFTITGTSSALLASGNVPNNTGSGTLPASAGQTVSRTVSTSVSTSVIGAGDNVGPGNEGTLELLANGVVVDSQAFATGPQNKTSGALRVSNDQAFPLATPGFWESFRTSGSGVAVGQGWNRLSFRHNKAGSTPDVFVVVETSANTAVTAVDASLNSEGTLAPSSGIPHFGVGGTVDVTLTATNLSLETYLPANILSVSGGVLSTVNYAAGQAGLPSILPRYMTTHSAAVTVPVDGGVSGVSPLTVTSRNTVSTDSLATTKKVLLNKGSAGSKVDEMGVPVTIAVNGGPSATIATRVDMTGGDFPADDKSALTTGDWISAAATQSYDAAVVGGVLSHDVVNYTTGFIPAGPDRSGYDADQYVTFMFRRTAVSKFDIKVTGSYSGMYVKLPGLTEANTNTTNGWLNMGTLYGGAGYAGDKNGANGSLGCALGAVANGSGTWTCTFGTLSSTNSSNNLVLVRFKLKAGQSISALSFVPATR